MKLSMVILVVCIAVAADKYVGQNCKGVRSYLSKTAYSPWWNLVCLSTVGLFLYSKGVKITTIKCDYTSKGIL